MNFVKDGDLYHVGSTKMDAQGRVLIQGLFLEVPKMVVLAISAEYEMIEVLPAESDGDNDIGIAPIPVDEKGRITLPAWIRKEIKESYSDFSGNLCLVVCSGRRFISPKTGRII